MTVSWHADALCIEYPQVDFFPRRGESTAEARAICGRCLVRDECLAAALRQGDKHGVWGGTSGVDRRRLRKGARSDRAAA